MPKKASKEANQPSSAPTRSSYSELGNCVQNEQKKKKGEEKKAAQRRRRRKNRKLFFPEQTLSIALVQQQCNASQPKNERIKKKEIKEEKNTRRRSAPEEIEREIRNF